MKKILLLNCTLLFLLLVTAQTPVAYYPFNGNANDAIGALNGTVSGAILSTDRFGNASSAFRFDGVDDNIDLSNSNVIRPTAALTISAWFNLENAAGAIAGRQILSCTENSGYQMAYDKVANTFVLYVRRNGGYGFVQVAAAPYLTGCHYMAGTFDGRFTRLYMDGVLVGTDDAGATFPIQYFSGVKTYIGAEASDPVAVGIPIDPNYYWQGRIDEVKIYSTALTAPQVLTEFTTNVGPVAHYPFNGNANDAIGTNNGTANGGAALTTDRFGNANSAYNFDGVDDFISTANLATNQIDNWAITAWVKPSSILQNNGTIVLNGFDNGVTGNGYGMVMGDATHAANGNLFKGLLAGVVFVTSAFTFSTNNIWYHTAIVREAGITKLYFNGVLSGTTAANIPNIPSGSLRIGSCTGIRFWNGAIDEVKIYNTALTATQVQQDFTSSNQQQKPGSGNAISFDGSGRSVVIPDNNNLNFEINQNFTIDFWLKLPVNQNNLSNVTNSILEKYSGAAGAKAPYLFQIYNSSSGVSNGVFQFLRSDGATFKDLFFINANDNKWHHVALHKEGNNLRLFKDGILQGSTTDFTSGTVSNTTNVLVGIRAAITPLTGEVDEVRFWNTTLTQSQIRDRMCKKITSTDALYSNLVAYYNFDESTGTTAFDGTINANNGTLNNSPTRVTSGAAIGNASSHDYVNATKNVSLTHAAGENLTISSTSGSPDGIQVYLVNEQPNTLTGASGVGDNNKYFGVFQAGGTTPQYTAVYNYNGNPFVTPAIESQLRLNKRTDNTATSWTTMAATPNELANTITVTGESTEYILGRLGGALPLNLISFTGKNINGNNLLSWKTDNEINTSHFDVERSINGINFIKIGTVAAFNRPGVNQYTFDDLYPAAGINLYRLKQVDINSKFEYSNTVKILFTITENISILPNPATDKLNIRLAAASGKWMGSIYDVQGKLVKQEMMAVAGNWLNVNITMLAKGNYMIVLNNGIEALTGRFMKQ
jgi:hypothetical protein